MGFNPTFYAGRPKLSQVTIDSDLNMGGRDISGVDALQADTIDVDLVRAGRVDSPYMPTTWPTETIEWGERSATDVFTESKKLDNTWTPNDGQWTPYTVPAGHGGKYTFTIRKMSGNAGTKYTVDIKILVNSVEVVNVESYSLSAITGSWTHTRWIDPGATVEVRMRYTQAGSYEGCELVITDTGTVGGSRTFNLTGKWLALGLDMKGLGATVKIQGVEIPYSDYAKYFPLAPTEITIPGNWDVSQVRPVVKVYV